ncbi:beta-ketoacyl synthase N-terminal-like domain-containing protein [Mesoterricola sediminis]|uniref:Beta-ketoacyl synthase-like N-terminal domain-containing protein n=1 Tax=Mesoterricola sediminis TaxID=2927980 RepID=A0AA48H1C4_9BACT|nr:beta-ketoacyl synthase N-terminal-like domain-containing protein [Mesoterricola sediminis]BDU75676.1 hypothetical protein METESE_06340 [Mesoterricola sediminis]
MNPAVLGVGAVGGFGAGARALLEPAQPGLYELPWGEGRRAIPAFRADTAPLERFVPRRALRRIDAFSRIALLGACLALEDAGMPTSGLEGLGVVLGSGYGATGTTFALIDSMIEGGDACASPTHFAGSLHNTPASHLAITLGATGPSLSLSRFQGLGDAVLLAARLMLAEGRATRVLAGVVDEVSDLTAYLWARGEGGTPPGEGAAFLVLGEGEGAYGSLDAAMAGRGPSEGPWGALPGADAFAVAAAAVRSSRR